MSTNPESLGFEGVLGRATLTANEAVLRLYEYSFLAKVDGEATPVFVARFRQPLFSEADIAPVFGAEVEIVLFEDRAEISEIYGDKQVVLRATSIVGQRAAYDFEDYVARVRQLDEAYAQLSGDLLKARKKDHEGHKLVIELLRRAEIKSAASEGMGQRQAAAIAVLQRLLKHFSAED